MADRMYQKITIGGDPGENRAKLMDMVDELHDEDGLEEDSDGLVVSDSECSIGDFDELKAFLREANLPYNHFSEAKWDYEGNIIWWRPGMLQEEPSLATQRQEQTIAFEELEKAMEASMSLAHFIQATRIPDLPNWVLPVHVGPVETE